jgi:hypothetical protein
MMPVVSFVTSVVTNLIPKAVESVVDYFSNKPETKKRDYTKWTSRDTETLVLMWKAWEDDKSLYQSQDKFAEEVNRRFGTSKSTTAIIAYIKRVIK